VPVEDALGFSASHRVRFAWSRLAWAVSTACDKDVVSMVAITVPAEIVSPAATLTAVTVPDVGKCNVFWFVLATDPV